MMCGLSVYGLSDLCMVHTQCKVYSYRNTCVNHFTPLLGGMEYSLFGCCYRNSDPKCYSLCVLVYIGRLIMQGPWVQRARCPPRNSRNGPLG